MLPPNHALQIFSMKLYTAQVWLQTPCKVIFIQSLKDIVLTESEKKPISVKKRKKRGNMSITSLEYMWEKKKKKKEKKNVVF